MLPNRLFAVLLPILCSAGSAYAHGVFVSYDIQPPDRVIITAFYQAAEPITGAKVRMLDAEDNVVAAGVTDSKGQYTFTISKPLAYRFEVITAGHRGECRIAADDVALLGSQGTSEEVASQSASAPPESQGHDENADHEYGHINDRDVGAGDNELFRDKVNGNHPEPWTASGLVSGLALILAAAAFAMTLALRRDIHALKGRSGDEGE